MPPHSNAADGSDHSTTNGWLVVIQSLGLLLASLLASFFALCVADSNREAVGKEPTFQLRLIGLHIACWEFVACLLAGFAAWLAMTHLEQIRKSAEYSPLSRATCSLTLGLLAIFAALLSLVVFLMFLTSILSTLAIETQAQEHL